MHRENRKPVLCRIAALTVILLLLAALPAPAEWTTERGLEVFGPRSFGFDVDYVPYC